MELWDRLAITIWLLPLALGIISLGGVVYLLGVLLVFVLAAREFVRLFQVGWHRPARPLLVAGVVLLIAAVHFPALNPRGALWVLVILAPLTWHLIDYERGAPASGTDFLVTIGGIFYLGWLGTYFIALRALPDGLWWLLTTLSGVWLSDTSAYAFGRLFGRHRLVPRLSPKKTWEGLAGGLFGGAAGAGLLSVFWHIGAGPDSLLTWQTGALLGALIGLLGPVGDLGISMFKRQIGVKDTGTLLAGHGGALDRIDSWLVAVALGYYFVLGLSGVSS